MIRYRIALTLLAGTALLGAVGCSTNVEKVDPNAPAAATAPSPAAAPTSGPAAPGGPEAAPSAPSAAATGGRNHAEQLRKVEELQAAYEKDTSNAETKAKLIAAKYDYGLSVMQDDSIPPRQKYRPALKQFNEVLRLDPNHQGAAEGKKIIEDIYRSMGMPIPKD